MLIALIILPCTAMADASGRAAWLVDHGYAVSFSGEAPDMGGIPGDGGDGSGPYPYDYFCRMAVEKMDYYSQYNEDIGCTYMQQAELCHENVQKVADAYETYELFECGQAGYSPRN